MFEIKVTKKTIRYLGIYIVHDNEENYNQNWIRIYHDIKKTLLSLGNAENKTIFGNSCIIRTRFQFSFKQFEVCVFPIRTILRKYKD